MDAVDSFIFLHYTMKKRLTEDLQECGCVKKVLALALSLAFALGLAGCKKVTRGSELYSFPEPTTLITGKFYSQGQETPFEVGSEDYDPNDLSTNAVITWFYDLELTPCDEPEAVEGSESYIFKVNGKDAFTYEDRGDEKYIMIDSNFYKVNNPSPPPIH